MASFNTIEKPFLVPFQSTFIKHPYVQDTMLDALGIQEYSVINGLHLMHF